MTLVALVGALGAKDAEPKYMLLAFFPIPAFWFLDAFYIQQERKYKALYREASEADETNFNLNTRLVRYTDEEAKRICFCRCLFSVSELLFYLPMTAALVVLAIILKVF